MKIAGRDSNVKCVIVDTMEKGYVLIDGETRRKKCNIRHLEPTSQVLKIAKGAGHDEVVAAFKSLNIEIAAKKPKQKAQKQVATKTEAKPKAKKPAKK